jgi:protease I
MADQPSGLRVAYLTSDEGMEQVEVTAPRPASTPPATEQVYYGAVVVRGGVTDGDLLRTASAAVSSVQELLDADKPSAGQRVLVETDVIRGQTRMSWPSMRSDVESAGGHWVETSGKHNDRPAFWAALTRVFTHQAKSA